MCIKKIVDNIITDIKRKDIETAISYAENLGKFIWLNNLNIFSEKKLEQYLTSKAIEKIDLKNKHEKITKKDHLFIATQMYFHGGHSRLAENLSIYLNKDADLLLTKEKNKKIIEHEKTFFNEIHIINNKKRNINQINDIVDIILNYKKIILNTHPDDIVTTIACIIAKKINPKIKFFFVNHADHVFSFGVSQTDVWFEISRYGITVDNERNLNCQKSFLGIPIKVKNINLDKLSFNDGDLIMTAASGYKFKPIDNFSIIPLIKSLLDKYKLSRCQVIGVNKYKEFWWWPIKLRYRSRLILTKTIPYSEYMQVTSKAKLYVDSYPIAGGTAFAEQFFQEKQCIGIKKYMWGYSPVDDIKKTTPKEVLEYLEENNRALLEKIKNNAIIIHSQDYVKSRFIDALNGKNTRYSDIINNSTKDDIVIRTRDIISIYSSKLPIASTEQLIMLIKKSTIKIKIKIPFIYLKTKLNKYFTI